MNPACSRCGRLLHTGEAKVIVAMTATEMEDLIMNTTQPELRARLLCALSLLDATRAATLA